MRIYNGKNSQVDMPLANGQRISISPKSVSGNIMPSNEFLSLLVSSYDYSEIALIVSGPFEINMCSQVSCCAGFIVTSLEEAIERFAPKKEKEAVNPEPNPMMLKDNKKESKSCDNDKICFDKKEETSTEEINQIEEKFEDEKTNSLKKKFLKK